MKYNITVVVCIYNSSFEKIRRTLFSVISQEGIIFDVVIADDGSIDNKKENIIDFFNKHHFNDYKIIIHKKNYGTVKNLYDAVVESDGEYIYAISPGDYIYDKYTLKYFYEKIKNSGKDFAFGDAIYYSYEDNILKFHETDYPKIPELYNCSGKLNMLVKTSYFSTNRPIGATYFRKRDTFLYYLNMIVGKVKYLEDYPLGALYLLDNKSIFYVNRPIIWYEYGSGISTCRSKVWAKRLKRDFNSSRDIIMRYYGDDRIVRAKYTKFVIERFKYLEICFLGIIYRILTYIDKSNKKIVNVNKNSLYEIIKK